MDWPCEDCSGGGRASRGSGAESTEEDIQLVGSVCASLLLLGFDVEAGDQLHTLRVRRPYTPSELPLYRLQLILISRSEGLLLLVQQILQLADDPGLVVRITADSPCRDCCILTEVNVVSDAVCHAVYVIPVRLAEHVLVSGLKAVLQSLAGILTPPPNCPCGDRLPLHCRNILWC